MIYKDALSVSDSESCPAKRLEDCLNCAQSWGQHRGWSCTRTRLSFYEIGVSTERYETQSMRDSLSHPKVPIIVAQQKPKGWDSLSTPKAPTAKAETDLSDWRAWRNQAPGECPCGIVKTMCDYHR